MKCIRLISDESEDNNTSSMEEMFAAMAVTDEEIMDRLRKLK